MRAVSQYLSPEHVEIVRRAYAFAAEAHDGQLRDSGQPYITHPLAAAETLAELHLDADSIAAGLLHDVAEDVGVELKDIAGQFGPDVAKLAWRETAGAAMISRSVMRTCARCSWPWPRTSAWC